MRRFLTACLCTAWIVIVPPAVAQLSPLELLAHQEKYKTYGTSSTPEILEIQSALEAHDFEKAIRISTVVLNQPEIASESPQFNAWIKSLAYLYRAHAIYGMNYDSSKAFPDIKKSADLGNLEAVSVLITKFLEADVNANSGFEPTTDELSKYFTTAADLLLSKALMALADGAVPVSFSFEQRTFWKLMNLVHSSEVSNQIRKLMGLIEAHGLASLGDVLEKEALVGRPFASRTAGVPGRDLFATIYAEHSLRFELGSSLGARATREKRAEAPTVMENFLFINTITGRRGFADMYLLVPGDPASRDNNVRTLAREGIIKEIGPSDSIWVSCGPLSHRATVFSIDLKKDELLLVDPMYEFWLPTHNSCISRLSHEHYKYGFYLPKVKVSEVVTMIDAVGTYRSAQFIGLAGDVSQTSLSLDKRQMPPDSTTLRSPSSPKPTDSGLLRKTFSTVMASDLIRAFNFVKTSSETLRDGRSTAFFRPSVSKFYGDVALIVSFDADTCVRSMTLTVRRSFIEDPQTRPFGKDIIKSFLKQTLGETSVKAVSPLIRQIKEYGQVGQPSANAGEAVDSLNTLAMKVFLGNKSSLEESLGPERIRMENLKASSGASLLRVAIW